MELSGEPGRWRVRWRAAGWSLLVALLGTAVAGALSVSWPGSYDDLRAAVAEGDVDRVGVSPLVAAEQVPRRGGRLEVRVVWRDGLLEREVVVVEARPGSRAAQLAAVQGRAVEPPGGTVAGLLADRPDLEVVVDDGPTGNVRFLGLSASGAFTVPLIASVVLLLLLIAFGPEPSRATRWAWFWLTGLPLVGPFLYLLLSGATVPTAPPAPGRTGRLTGGWAFLVNLAIGSFAAAVTRAGGWF